MPQKTSANPQKCTLHANQCTIHFIFKFNYLTYYQYLIISLLVLFILCPIEWNLRTNNVNFLVVNNTKFYVLYLAT